MCIQAPAANAAFTLEVQEGQVSCGVARAPIAHGGNPRCQGDWSLQAATFALWKAEMGSPADILMGDVGLRLRFKQ